MPSNSTTHASAIHGLLTRKLPNQPDFEAKNATGLVPKMPASCSAFTPCPANTTDKAAKDQVIKFALKRQFEVVLVAGQSQIKPTYALVKLIVVPSGPDAADDYLVEHAVPGELVICSDVPLADRLVKKGVAALDPRGKEFDPQNMGERLAVRNLFTDLREQGQVSGGQGAYGERDKQAFANALDRILTRLARG